MFPSNETKFSIRGEGSREVVDSSDLLPPPLRELDKSEVLFPPLRILSQPIPHSDQVVYYHKEEIRIQRLNLMFLETLVGLPLPLKMVRSANHMNPIPISNLLNNLSQSLSTESLKLTRLTIVEVQHVQLT